MASRLTEQLDKNAAEIEFFGKLLAYSLKTQIESIA